MQRDMCEKAAVLTCADIPHSQLSRMQRDMCEKETYLRMQKLEMSEKDTAVRQLQREVTCLCKALCPKEMRLHMLHVCCMYPDVRYA